MLLMVFFIFVAQGLDLSSSIVSEFWALSIALGECPAERGGRIFGGAGLGGKNPGLTAFRRGGGGGVAEKNISQNPLPRAAAKIPQRRAQLIVVESFVERHLVIFMLYL